MSGSLSIERQQKRHTPILNRSQKLELEDKIIQWKLEGKPNTEIIRLCQVHSPNPLNQYTAQTYIDSAKKRLEDNVEQDAQVIATVHLNWYEEIYAYFHSINNIVGMNMAMKGKERLLGLYRKNTKVEFNKKTNININREVSYNVEKLNNREQTRLQELINKTK